MSLVTVFWLLDASLFTTAWSQWFSALVARCQILRKCVLHSLQIFCFSAGYFNSFIPCGLWVILEDLGNNLSTNHNCCHVQSQALLTAGFLMPQICQLRLYCYQHLGLDCAPSYACSCLLEREKDAKKLGSLCPHCWRSFLCVYQLVAIGYNGPVESGGVVQRLQATLQSALLFLSSFVFFQGSFVPFAPEIDLHFYLNVSILLVLIPQLCCSTGFITHLSEKLPLREKKGSGGTCTV